MTKKKPIKRSGGGLELRRLQMPLVSMSEDPKKLLPNIKFKNWYIFFVRRADIMSISYFLGIMITSLNSIKEKSLFIS